MEKTSGNCRWAEWKKRNEEDILWLTEGKCTNKKAIDILTFRIVGVGHDYDCPEWMPKLKTAEPSTRGMDSISSEFDHN